MSPTASAIHLLRTQVTSYSQYTEEEELWKSVREADACRDLESLLATGIGIFKSIAKYTDGKVIDSEILDIVNWWLRPCERVDKGIKAFEALKYKVDGADEFRQCWQVAKKLSKLVPTTWRGQKIYSEKELQESDFPFPPEPE